MGVTQKLETERLLLEITFGFKDKYLRIPVVFFYGCGVIRSFCI